MRTLRGEGGGGSLLCGGGVEGLGGRARGVIADGRADGRWQMRSEEMRIEWREYLTSGLVPWSKMLSYHSSCMWSAE